MIVQRQTNMFVFSAGSSLSVLWVCSWDYTKIKWKSKCLHTWALHIYRQSHASYGLLVRAHSPTERQLRSWQDCDPNKIHTCDSWGTDREYRILSNSFSQLPPMVSLFLYIEQSKGMCWPNWILGLLLYFARKLRIVKPFKLPHTSQSDCLTDHMPFLNLRLLAATVTNVRPTHHWVLTCVNPCKSRLILEKMVHKNCCKEALQGWMTATLMNESLSPLFYNLETHQWLVKW